MARKSRRPSKSARAGADELGLLYEIHQILDGSIELRDVVNPVLQAMAAHMGMVRGTITLLDRETGDIVTEAAFGLSDAQVERGRYKLGEGVTGKVIQTGEPAVVPRVSEEPMFLDRTRSRRNLKKEDISFICVPIKSGDDVVGALSADRMYDESVSFEEDVQLLSVIASMIAQSVALRRRALEERKKLLEENLRLKEALRDRFHPSNIIGNSRAMQEVYGLIDIVSKSETTALIRGESGTGKELVAQAIHYNSLRSEMPLVKVNCAALPETVVESELFGHERGAFTGAHTMRKGRFELADGGTIFLDEIGDLSASTQIKLLRVLQEKEFERVGGTESIKVDVRLIAATNRDIEAMMENGSFRLDLFYRLNVFPIYIPPLRERKADIPLLADYFAEKYSNLSHKDVKRISTPAIDMLMAYHWPGNVRELENCIERAVLLSQDGVIHGHHLPPTLQTAEASGTVFRGNLKEALENFEREIVQDALKSSRGNMARAARALGITERIMGLRVRKYDIEPRRFRTRM